MRKTDDSTEPDPVASHVYFSYSNTFLNSVIFFRLDWILTKSFLVVMNTFYNNL